MCYRMINIAMPVKLRTVVTRKCTLSQPTIIGSYSILKQRSVQAIWIFESLFNDFRKDINEFLSPVCSACKMYHSTQDATVC